MAFVGQGQDGWCGSAPRPRACHPQVLRVNPSDSSAANSHNHGRWDASRDGRLGSILRWIPDYATLQQQGTQLRVLSMNSHSQVGKVPVGSEHRIALQTMTTTDTRNIQATVDQVLQI